MQQPHLDIAIFGAGIAGLWTLAHLQQAGYRVALFERHALGGVQSIASQGIIHGGTKYALTGKLTGSAMAIGEMPGLHLQGLVTMAPWDAPEELIRTVFRQTRLLAEWLQGAVPGTDLIQLSMGMTDDFEIAIEEGATHIRVGRAIFGSRRQ